MADLRTDIARIIGITVPNEIANVVYKILESVKEDGYTRQLIEYDSDGDKVSAYLLLPEILENNPAILINHQHNREHHLGKSEVLWFGGKSSTGIRSCFGKKRICCVSTGFNMF